MIARVELVKLLTTYGSPAEDSPDELEQNVYRVERDERKAHALFRLVAAFRRGVGSNFRGGASCAATQTWTPGRLPRIDHDALLELEHAADLLDTFEAPPASTEVSSPSGQPDTQPERLSESELRIVKVLHNNGARMTSSQIIAVLDRDNGGCTSEGTTKVTLASLGRRGILDNRQDVKPNGYGLTDKARGYITE
jgi:hypothetical protein